MGVTIAYALIMVLGYIAIGVFGVAIIVGVIWRAWKAPAPELRVPGDPSEPWPVTPGEYGIAATPLRPCGCVEFEGKPIEARSDAGFVDAGARVRVVKCTRAHVLVIAA